MMSNKSFNLWATAALLGILFTIGCDIKKHSYGDFDRIFVFADSINFLQSEAALGEVFDRFIYTPHSEKSFYFGRENLQNLDTYKSRRTLVFLGVLNEDKPVSKYVQNMLSEEVRRSVEQGQSFEFFRYNVYAEDQLVIILVANDSATLIEKLRQNSDKIYNTLEKYHFERLSRAMFLEGEQTNIENYLAKEYGWSIQVQYSYQIVKDSDEHDFFWIKRLNPDRNLSISRIKYDSLETNQEKLIALRDQVAAEYFQKDSVLVDDTYLSFVEFAGKRAAKLSGVWQNHQLIMGGPFRTYFLYDEKSGFLYLVDLHVVAPGKRKKPYLDQLEVMANTFRFVD